MNLKLKVKKGDQVIVLSGDDKGKTGEVLKAMPKDTPSRASSLPAALSLKKRRFTFPMWLWLIPSPERQLRSDIRKKTAARFVLPASPVK